MGIGSTVARIECPHCGKGYQLTPEKHAQAAGRKIACKACQKAFVIPPMEKTATIEEPQDLEMAAPAAYAPTPAPMPAAAPAPRHVGMNRPRVHEDVESNGWAKGALIAGIAGLIIPIVAAVVAMLLGIIALIKARRPNVAGRGVAIAGMGIAIIGVALHAMLVSAALPRFHRAAEIANRVQCASRIRQIGRAMEIYVKANKSYPAKIEDLLLVTQDLKPEDLVCPDAHDDTPASGASTTEQLAALRASPHGHVSYVYLAGQLNYITTVPETILLYEPQEHHVDGMNVMLGNRSIAWFDAEDTKWVLSELNKGNNPPHVPPKGWRKY